MVRFLIHTKGGVRRLLDWWIWSLGEKVIKVVLVRANGRIKSKGNLWGWVGDQEFSFGHTDWGDVYFDIWKFIIIQCKATWLFFFFLFSFLYYFFHTSSETQRNNHINTTWSYTLQEAHTSITTLLRSLHILTELFPWVCKTWNVSKCASYIIVSGTQQHSLIRITNQIFCLCLFLQL